MTTLTLNNTSETDVAPWCYKWVDGMDWISPGGVKYRAPYGANKTIARAHIVTFVCATYLLNMHCNLGLGVNWAQSCLT